MANRVIQQPQKGVTGGFTGKPNLTERRKQMKYKVSTTSTTASGVVPIKGATKYPAEPSIYFTREAWVKQCHLVSKCQKEVGWFALVDYSETDNSFTITELVIPNQEVTGTETDIGKEDLADAAMELIEAGKDTSKMYAWFHSHVNMGVSPSGQDEYQVEDFLEDLADQPEIPAFIRGIQNKAGDLKIDVYYVQHGIAYQNVEFYVIHDDDPQWLVDIEAEIKTKVKERVYQSYTYNNRGFGGSRQSTGKSGNASASANGLRDTSSWDDNWKQAYGVGADSRAYWDSYYDDEETDMFSTRYDGVEEVDDTVVLEDSPQTPRIIDIPYDAYMEMDTVYSSASENTEVLLDPAGQLWVCDPQGNMYDYSEYTEVYGEIDAGSHRAVI